MPINNESIQQWIDNNCTGRQETVSCNGLKYLFCTMKDGYIAIIDITNSLKWHTVIQACNRNKAIEYITMIEPLNISATELIPR